MNPLKPLVEPFYGSKWSLELRLRTGIILVLHVLLEIPILSVFVQLQSDNESMLNYPLVQTQSPLVQVLFSVM